MRNKIKEIRDEIRYRIYKLKFRLFGFGPGPVRRILSNQDGVGTVEVVLLILVAVGLVLIFKTRITELVGSIFDSITSRAGKI